MSDSNAKRIFREIVNAVAYCHRNNFAHRDLKLENILMTAQGQIKLCDFGFAKSFDKSCFSETFCGSLPYCAPEILQGNAYNAFSTDVWSLGVILFAMVTGEMPFDNSNVRQMVWAQSNKFLPSNQIASECLALIESMLEPESVKRASIKDVMASKWLN